MGSTGKIGVGSAWGRMSSQLPLGAVELRPEAAEVQEALDDEWGRASRLAATFCKSSDCPNEERSVWLVHAEDDPKPERGSKAADEVDEMLKEKLSALSLLGGTASIGTLLECIGWGGFTAVGTVVRLLDEDEPVVGGVMGGEPPDETSCRSRSAIRFIFASSSLMRDWRTWVLVLTLASS